MPFVYEEKNIISVVVEQNISKASMDLEVKIMFLISVAWKTLPHITKPNLVKLLSFFQPQMSTV